MPKTSFENLIFSATKGDIKAGKFSGIAYSGEMIPNHGWWGNLVFDLDSMEAPSNIPTLLEHRVNNRLGFVSDSEISHEKGLAVSGSFLDPEKNQYSKEVQDDAEAGFPWQMSVLIEPDRIERVFTETEVNGRKINATQESPLVIFRNSVIREVSFVAIGADRHTNATAFGNGETFEYSINDMEGDMPKPTGDNADLAAENARLQRKLDEISNKFSAQGKQVEALTQQLEQQAKEARTSAVSDLYSELSIVQSKEAAAEAATRFAAMDDGTFKFFADQMKLAADAAKHVADDDMLLQDLQFSGSAGGNKGDNLLAEAAKSLVQGG